jgi:hypothetical protein
LLVGPNWLLLQGCDLELTEKTLKSLFGPSTTPPIVLLHNGRDVTTSELLKQKNKKKEEKNEPKKNKWYTGLT